MKRKRTKWTTISVRFFSGRSGHWVSGAALWGRRCVEGTESARGGVGGITKILGGKPHKEAVSVSEKDADLSLIHL